MLRTDGETWTDRLRDALACYETPLLRQVGENLLRLRSKPAPPDLIDRLVAVPANPVAVDRILKSLGSGPRTFFALIHMSRQPCWRMQSLLELLSWLETADGTERIRELFECGLLLPDWPAEQTKLKSFADWLGRAGATQHRLFAHPLVSQRAAQVELDSPALSDAVTTVSQIRDTDGLEIFLRLGALWQQVRASPLRLTQQGEFFKRDQDRLKDDPFLGKPLADSPEPDSGHFVVALALQLGVVRRDEGQLSAGDLPDAWSAGLVPSLTGLWAALPGLDLWNADAGWIGFNAAVSPFASARLLALALLARLKPGDWVVPQEVGRVIAERHCAWRGQPNALDEWAERYLLGVAAALRLVVCAVDPKGRSVVQISDTGLAVLALAPAAALPELPKTLFVQPNLEIVAYRQGLTPGLIGALTRFANWSTLGAACTLQLAPESVYRGLETGCTFEQILHTLQQHGVRALPDAVVQSLRTWADKRERLAVYSAAVLLEFTQSEDLEAALARGLQGIRVADRFLLVPREENVDYRHLRLAGSRDYGLPPGQCVDVDADGVTLALDLAKADLLVETEIERFAELVLGASANGRRIYRLTPKSLQHARSGGTSVAVLEAWFPQRTGQPLTAAARLLLGAPPGGPLRLGSLVVLEVPIAELADGLVQWPSTRDLIQSRLGPLALAIAEEHLPSLRQRLAELGLEVNG